jgi:hypothetical protein
MQTNRQQAQGGVMPQLVREPFVCLGRAFVNHEDCVVVTCSKHRHHGGIEPIGITDVCDEGREILVSQCLHNESGLADARRSCDSKVEMITASDRFSHRVDQGIPRRMSHPCGLMAL